MSDAVEVVGGNRICPVCGLNPAGGGAKCSDCAAAAVRAWREEREQAAREKIQRERHLWGYARRA